MTFKLRLFICSADHQSKHWAWDSVRHIRCLTKGCRRLAYRAIVGRGHNAQNAQPFVYYERADGDIFIAATSEDTRAPRGYLRKEVRTMREYSRFQREQRSRRQSELELVAEGDRMDKAIAGAESRRLLDVIMKDGFIGTDGERHRLSPEGEAFARAAMERSYEDRGPRPSAECHIEGFEQDRGNRSEYADEHHGWRRYD